MLSAELTKWSRTPRLHRHTTWKATLADWTYTKRSIHPSSSNTFKRTSVSLSTISAMQKLTLSTTLLGSSNLRKSLKVTGPHSISTKRTVKDAWIGLVSQVIKRLGSFKLANKRLLLWQLLKTMQIIKHQATLTIEGYLKKQKQRTLPKTKLFDSYSCLVKLHLNSNF